MLSFNNVVQKIISIVTLKEILNSLFLHIIRSWNIDCTFVSFEMLESCNMWQHKISTSTTLLLFTCQATTKNDDHIRYASSIMLSTCITIPSNSKCSSCGQKSPCLCIASTGFQWSISAVLGLYLVVHCQAIFAFVMQMCHPKSANVIR